MSINENNQFINSLGTDNNIIFQYKVKDSENIVIKNSKNDCVDVSAGSYNFNFLDLDICGDKGLSIGEKSKIDMLNLCGWSIIFL